ncbi:MAG: precorrin-8X methylmutase [Pseudomonadota bacterium]
MQPVAPRSDYIRDPAEIYAGSFATVSREAALGDLSPSMAKVATRLIHACGMVDLMDDLAFSEGAAEMGCSALASGARVFCDVEMVRAGIIARLLPRQNDVICTLNDTRVPALAETMANTRSAAAVELWRGRMEGGVVAIGNAPTALFHLLDIVAATGEKPALVIGIPVGFVGAVESKAALAANELGLNYITVHGRRGGSAMASAVVNALAGGLS